MVVRVINEIERLPDPSWRERLSRRIGRPGIRNVILFGLTVCVSGVLLYVLLDGYAGAWHVPARVTVAMAPSVTPPVDPPADPAIQRIDARVDGALARVSQIDQDVRTRLQSLEGNAGGRPETDRVAPPETRPWVLHSEGLQAIDSRDPETSKTTEIHVAAALSDSQVETLATEVDTRAEPRFNALANKLGSHLDQKLEEIASENRLSNAQLTALKVELVQSVSGALQDERARNQQLWEDNATYRVLFERSLDLNQDLIALYAAKTKDNHAIGNVLRVVPKLFTLQVWQNKDDGSQYLQLLSRYEAIATESQEISGSAGLP